MTRPTTTRAALRRAIAMRLMMPFARRVPNGHSHPVSSTTFEMTDSVHLKQVNQNYWTGQWFYDATADEVRQIVRSDSNGTIDFEYAISPAPSSSDEYEIHSIFNALEIHQAINDAISTSYPSFFETVEDTSLVICEDKLEYDLTDFTTSVGIVHEVALERPVTRMYGTVASTSYDGVNDLLTINLESTVDLSNVDTDWYISIYDGTGKGVAYAVITANNTSKYVTVSAASDPGLDTTSDYLLWDAQDQELDWYRMKFVHFDAKEWPSKLRLYSPVWDYRGSRLRIKYSTMPSALTAETSTTSVPKEYVVSKAIAYLAASRVGDNRVDRQRYAIMQEMYHKEAEEFKARNFFRLPDNEMFMEGRDYANRGELDPQGDPLGWWRR